MTKIDYLLEDDVINSQKYCCISFLSPEGVSESNIRGVKVRGCYATYEEACKRAEFLQKVDKDFNIYVGEVGKWMPWDDQEKVEDNVYREQELNNLMKNYKENQEKMKEIEEQRKRDMLDKAIQEAKESKEAKEKENEPLNPTHEHIKKKLENRKKEEIDNELIQDKEEINKLQTNIDDNNKSVSDIDKKLEQIQNLYSTMNKV